VQDFTDTSVPEGMTGNTLAVPYGANPYTLENVKREMPVASKVAPSRASFNATHGNRFASAGSNRGKSVGGNSVGMVKARDPYEAQKAREKFQARRKPTGGGGGLTEADALESMMKGFGVGGPCGCADPNC